MDWYRMEKRMVSDLMDADIVSLQSSNSTGQAAATYISRMQEGVPVIDTQAIRQILDGLVFPLCFYDYETVSTPIPLFDGYRPWQQVVVQYSMHIVYEDGTIEHKQSIMQS